MARRDPNRREGVMLAHKYQPGRSRVNSWFLSEKLDGMRAWWDGGVSRGMPTANVPWANTEKDGRLIKQSIATGLWSRLLKPIYAPDFWLDQLPPFCLDGELYIDRQMFQLISSIVKRHVPDVSGWSNVKYMVIDSPPIEALFRDGLVKGPMVEKLITGAVSFVGMYGSKLITVPTNAYMSYRMMQKFLNENLTGIRNVRVLEHKEIPPTTKAAEDFINQELERIVELRGEGVVLRSPCGLWTPDRSYDMLKYKPFEDAEGTVTGYVSGRETDKGSKLLGLMGAMIVSWQEKIFELSGFTDEERRFATNAATQFAAENPGQRMPTSVSNASFPIGSRVTFRYRELSDAGVPKEARYLRKAD